VMVLLIAGMVGFVVVALAMPLVSLIEGMTNHK
jgi:hypothetical protein